MANRIGMFIHCRRCLASMPKGQSPATWAWLSVGWTNEGLQVWCERHDINVADFHLDGAKVRNLGDDYAGDRPAKKKLN